MLITAKDMQDFNKLSDQSYSLLVPAWARTVRDNILSNATIASINGDASSLIHLTGLTDMPKYHLGLYDLIKLVNLEAYALTYIVDTDYSLIKQMKVSELDDLHTNLEWICEFIGHYRKYRVFLQYFRDMDIAIYYMQAQLEMIINSGNLKQTLGSYMD